MQKQNKTRLQIVDALDGLLKQDSIEHIKVTQICQQVGISRTTFYSYFSDVFEVVTWMWDYVMEDALYAVGKTVNYSEGHTRSFYALLEHLEFFRNAFKSKAYYGAFEYGSRKVKEVLISNAEENLGRPFTREELLHIDFRSYGAAAITRQWVIDGAIETPEEMSEIIRAGTPAFFFQLLSFGEEYKPKTWEL